MLRNKNICKLSEKGMELHKAKKTKELLKKFENQCYLTLRNLMKQLTSF